MPFPGTFAAETPDKPAVIMAGTGQVITYAELDAEANQLSRLLRSAGLRRATTWPSASRTTHASCACSGAATTPGSYYTAMSSRLTTDEMAYILEDCGARAFITSSYKAEQAAELRDRMPGVEVRLVLDGAVDGYERYEDALAAHPPTPLDEERGEGQDMLYSSGTTGQPKGVKVAVPPGALGEGADGVTIHGPAAVRRGLRTPCTSPPRRSTTPLRCASAARRTASAAPSS